MNSVGASWEFAVEMVMVMVMLVVTVERRAFDQQALDRLNPVPEEMEKQWYADSNYT